MFDEMQVSSMAAFVRNAHIGLLDKELVHGTITFGYRGEAIPGEMVHERRIDVRCNRATPERRTSAAATPVPNRPLDRVGGQSAARQPTLHRGFRLQSKGSALAGNQGYARQYAREKPLAERRIERLRIIDDATLASAQSRLGEHVGRGGRPPAGAEPGEHAPHLLRELLWRPRHKRFLGTYGHDWACLSCKNELRQLGKDDISCAGALSLADRSDPGGSSALRNHR
jgi:hypothetical protein